MVSTVFDRGIIPLANRNVLINGGFDIWQRGTSVNIGSGNTSYSADRWLVSNESGISATTTRNTKSLSNIWSTRYHANIEFTGTSQSSGRSNIRQRIEDVRTLANEEVTISFFAADTNATDVIIILRQYFGTGGTPSTNVDTLIALTNVLSPTFENEKITATLKIPSIEGKTLGTNDNSYLELLIIPQAENAHTFSIGEIQLERGLVATPFEVLPITTIEQLCYRYYQVILTDSDPNNLNLRGGLRSNGGSLYHSTYITFLPMRKQGLTLDESHTIASGSWANVSIYIRNNHIIEFLGECTAEGSTSRININRLILDAEL